MSLVEPTELRRAVRAATRPLTRGAAPRPVAPTATPPNPTTPRLNLRLLNRLTPLTPEQALVIGADLVDAVLARHAAARPLGGFRAEHVWIGADGSVSVERQPSAIEVPGQRVASDTGEEPDRLSGPRTEEVAKDLHSTRALLAGLAARATHQPQRPGADTSEVRGAALDLASVTTQSDGDLATSAARLRPAAVEIGPGVRTELAALVAAGSDTTPAPPPPEPPRLAPPVSADRAAEAEGVGGRAAEVLRRQAERGWTALARLGRWALALLVLLAVLALELFLLGDRISADLAALRAAGQSSDRVPATAEAPLEPVAPSAAGAVASVDLRALARCAPGGDCQVRVFVRLVPAPEARRVQWHYVVLDRCSGVARRVDGGSVTVAPGGREVAVVGQLSVPPGRALAVTVVVEEPARAGSTAVLVPADGGC
ncbi:MAG TPA: hypothetical protein VH141_28485 [Pseudonocardia sp.]|jgi:hypothetical protein|nr:hypothetical protein [Pseudonocardia sp.]